MKKTNSGSENRSRFGEPSLPIKSKYIKEALKLLVKAATIVQDKKIVTPDMQENPITYYLDSEMNQLQRVGESDLLYWNVRPMHEVNDDPLKRGELDIKFQWVEYPLNNERYLGVEAKKLLGTGHDTLSSNYIKEGVMDFISCKYGRGHNYGIMLGYVVVGPFSKAINAVSKGMTKHRIETVEHSAFAINSSFSTYPYTYHSIHVQQGTSVLFTLIHLFFDFS